MVATPSNQCVVVKPASVRLQHRMCALHAHVLTLLVNHVGWSDGQLVLEPFCSISRIGAGHIWCQYILIAYCNSPFPGLNMLGQRPI